MSYTVHCLNTGSPVPCCVLFKYLMKCHCDEGIVKEELYVIYHPANCTAEVGMGMFTMASIFDWSGPVDDT